MMTIHIVCASVHPIEFMAFFLLDTELNYILSFTQFIILFSKFSLNLTCFLNL